jgi:hypothetical protein
VKNQNAAVYSLGPVYVFYPHIPHRTRNNMIVPFLSDDLFILIFAKLDARTLGRVAAVARRFNRKNVGHPSQGFDDRWSIAEEGARLALAAHREHVRGWVSRADTGLWLRALADAERLLRPLRFSDGSAVTLSEAGAAVTTTQAPEGQEWFDAAGPVVRCGDHEMRRGRHYAGFTLRRDGVYGCCLGVVGGDGCIWMIDSMDSTLLNDDFFSDWDGKPRGLGDGDELV